jgi:pyruvate formate lyase activating enzyme
MVTIHNTAWTSLVRAAELGREAGLKFVYVGNLPGMVDGLEDMRCAGCGATLVRRRGFRILDNRVGVGGTCPECGGSMPGIWTRAAELRAANRN